MRNLLIIAPYCYPRIGGGETHIMQLASSLKKKRFNVKILTLKLERALNYEIIEEVPILRFGGTNNMKEKIKGYIEIEKFIDNNITSITLIYLLLGVGREFATEQIIKLIDFSRSRRIPVVLRISSSGRVTELKKNYSKLTLPFRKADAYIALNKGIVKELIATGINRNKIHLIHNGVNSTIFNPKNEDSQDGNIKNCRIFLNVSRFCQKKNIPLLINVWKALEKKNLLLNSKLIIIGNDKEEYNKGVISNKIKLILNNKLKSKSIKIINGIPHNKIMNNYKNANIFISLSEQEGMSNSILEAMSSGLMIVAPKTDASKELIKNNYNGLLFKESKKNKVENAITEVIQMSLNKITLIGSNNRKIILEKYRIDNMVNNFINLFNSILSN